MSKKCVIFLSGVFLSDCVEIDEPVVETNTAPDIVPSEDLVIEEENSDGELPNLYCGQEDNGCLNTEYDTMLNWFYNPAQWTKSTNLSCWRCGLICREHPWFIPLTKTKKLVAVSTDGSEEIIDDIDSSDAALLTSSRKCKEITVYKPYGVFCTPWCVMAKLNREIDPKIINKWQCIELLKEIYKMYYGKVPTNIPECYYPKEMMIQYCGSSNGITPELYRQMNHQKAMEHLQNTNTYNKNIFV